ncbi:uracil phosphoribosyltransferase [Aequorivita antarctica]|uniref:Uracil phosphoribosyltransferase n=1 Tax=Aequorivita antarctica TaxID=153266 RepID=A0A5C6YY02_9FLAO|nr:uracil phosphoribosyltransferase [Aequorivita antarctica]TXD71951.1 uracil phosphoribosyltransferase [Aequorivita antarctica]SRX72942.1 Uracil phosphoribosyltransferase [Aequorivita antarctica]
MILHDFSKENSVLNQFILEMRDVSIQKDSMRFRKNVERIGEILSFEMSKTLNFKTVVVPTPLGNKEMLIPENDLVVCSILRAALPLHNGILNFFDTAENAFISAYRHHPDGGDDFEVIVNYLASPSIEGKILVLTDPMLATGRTLENVLKAFNSHGTPKQINIISIIGAKPGIEYIEKIFPENTHLWIAAVDDELNSSGYIIPGLGDAGDLSFGQKL